MRVENERQRWALPRMRRMLALLWVLGLAGTVAGCVVVPARPVVYHPVVVRPYAYVVY